MRNFLRRLEANFEPMMIICLFYSLLIILVAQIFLRKFAQGGFPWAEEVCRFIFVWLMYFCFSYATRNQRHIKVRFLVNTFPEKVQKSLAIVIDFLWLGFSIVMLIATFRIVQSTAYFGDRAISLDISMNFLYVAGLVGFILMAVRVLLSIWWKFRNWNEPLEQFENVFGKYYDNSTLWPFFIDKKEHGEPVQELNHLEKGNVD